MLCEFTALRLPVMQRVGKPRTCACVRAACVLVLLTRSRSSGHRGAQDHTNGERPFNGAYASMRSLRPRSGLDSRTFGGDHVQQHIEPKFLICEAFLHSLEPILRGLRIYLLGLPLQQRIGKGPSAAIQLSTVGLKMCASPPWSWVALLALPVRRSNRCRLMAIRHIGGHRARTAQNLAAAPDTGCTADPTSGARC